MASPFMQIAELVIALDESREESHTLQARVAELSKPSIIYPYWRYEEPYGELLRRRNALVKLFELQEYPAAWKREERRWDREIRRWEREEAEDRVLRRGIAEQKLALPQVHGSRFSGGVEL